MKKNMFLILTLLFSIIFSYLISVKMLIDDLGGRAYYGLYLFFICLIIINIGIYYSRIIQEKYKYFKSYRILNTLSLLFITSLNFLIVLIVTKMFFFKKENYLSDGWTEKLILLQNQNQLFLIISYVILFIILFIYLFIYLNKVKKEYLFKSIFSSLGYSILTLVLFGLIVIVIRILFYIILTFTVGISVG